MAQWPDAGAPIPTINKREEVDMKALRCDQIVLENEVFDGYVIVDGEKIRDLATVCSGKEIVDYRGLVLMPGLVDCTSY